MSEAEPSEETKSLTKEPDPLHDLFYSRFREHDSEISGAKARISAVESRLTGMEYNIAEQRKSMHEMTSRIDSISVDIQKIYSSQRDLTSVVHGNTNLFVRHTAEEADRQEHQTRAIQGLTKMILAVFTVLGILTISLNAFSTILAEKGLDKDILGLLGLFFGS